MRTWLAGIVIVAGCAAPTSPRPTREQPSTPPAMPVVAVASPRPATPTIALKGSKVVTQAEASAWLRGLEAPESEANPPPEPAPIPVSQASRVTSAKLDRAPAPAPSLRDRARPATGAERFRAHRRPPPPRPPAPCGVVHPEPPGTWRDASEVCRGPVHVLIEDADRADVVFRVWEDLLSRVRATRLRFLAEAPSQVFVVVYASGAACASDIDRPYAGAIYDVRNRIARVGDYRRSEGGQGRFQAVLRHELAHHLLYGRRSHRVPRWVSEGISELFEADPQATFANAPERLPLLDLIAWSGPNDPQAGVRYRAARTLVGGILRQPELGPRFARLVSVDRPWPDGLLPLLQELDAESSDLREAYEAQRRWRAATPVGRVGQRLTSRAGWFQPWMLLIGIPGLALLTLGVRLARPSVRS